MEKAMRVSFGGKELPILLTDGITLDEVGQLLERHAQVQRETIKLLLPGRGGKPLLLTDHPGLAATAAGTPRQHSARLQVSEICKALAGFCHSKRLFVHDI